MFLCASPSATRGCQSVLRTFRRASLRAQGVADRGFRLPERGSERRDARRSRSPSNQALLSAWVTLSLLCGVRWRAAIDGDVAAVYRMRANAGPRGTCIRRALMVLCWAEGAVRAGPSRSRARRRVRSAGTRGPSGGGWSHGHRAGSRESPHHVLDAGGRRQADIFAVSDSTRNVWGMPPGANTTSPAPQRPAPHRSSSSRHPARRSTP